MKYTEIKINQNKIEFHNSILGVEKIMFNGKEVSKKFSFLGTTHNFEIEENNYKITSKCQSLCWDKVKIIIERNNEKIYEKSIPINLKHKVIWFIVGLIIGTLITRINF